MFPGLNRLTNHKENKTYLIANALITDKNREKTYNNCLKTIESYEKALTAKPAKQKKFMQKKQELATFFPVPVPACSRH